MSDEADLSKQLLCAPNLHEKLTRVNAGNWKTNQLYCQKNSFLSLVGFSWSAMTTFTYEQAK